jgi:hypothetical protein
VSKRWVRKKNAFFLTKSKAKMKNSCCSALHDVWERGYSFNLCLRGIFARYIYFHLRDKDRLLGCFMV